MMQDIWRGNNCVIVFDFKGDVDYFKWIYLECQCVGCKLLVFYLGYLEMSVCYNVIGFFLWIIEVVSWIVSQLLGEGDVSVFKEFVW